VDDSIREALVSETRADAIEVAEEASRLVDHACPTGLTGIVTAVIGLNQHHLGMIRTSAYTGSRQITAPGARSATTA
jgi:hypothetical protein